MKITYFDDNPETKDSKSYTILNENVEPIGSVEGNINKYGVLTSVVRINLEYQQKGLGFKSFSKVFDELNKEVEIKKIIGSWNKDEEFADCENGMSTNLKIFLDCISNEKPEYCAFKTATGKWAKKLGFNNCNIVRKSTESATIEFYK
ncbi:hypothetical protein [Zobellia alginiliquefaciens]|uniref:hypothetical protein n=1 Tax=Zobellia alginiliquefaciens TaxID=3032586 RepID=UPI0023E3C16C|nr:hypothetical protein [Zobellia alginiliquefaciens]